MPDEPTGQMEIPTAQPAQQPDPTERISREFNQRFGEINDRLNTLVTVVASQQVPQSPASPPGSPSTASPAGSTDDELFAQAQQGNKAAFEEWTTRTADRRLNQRLQHQDSENLVDGQLRALMGKYPAFTDASHPLTQTANLAFELMKRRGMPANKATLLDAAKTAIADRPDLIVDMAAPVARERARRGSVSQASMTGASHRADSPPPRGRQMGISEQEWKIAKRMGIENPEKARTAKERFLQRQESGLSSLGTVAAFVNDENF